MKRKRTTYKEYPHVIPEITDWPIYKLHQNRRKFVDEIVQYTLEQLEKKFGDELNEILAKSIYKERIRVKEEPWKVDPADDRTFWKRMQKQIAREGGGMVESEAKEVNREVLEQIIRRYAEEIVGTFRVKTFLFARKFLTFFFGRLLNTAANPNIFKGLFQRAKYRLYERLIARGEIKQVRELIKKGTVVILPTHFSNLDSILIGYVMDVLGLPSFSYGAGLNLYNSGAAAYYMNRLGAYRVDRRKKNAVYLEVLKSMSSLSIQRGTNSLFFPGGTRSRNGALEDRLKMGLLGTVVESQRAHFQRNEDEKIFVVPVVISYHVVLEAKYLIEQFLKRTGKERYVRTKDDFRSIFAIIRFAWNVFSRGSTITVSFGKPMDVLGNFVDEEGRSHDQFGKPVNVRDYFVGQHGLEENLQRETEYTRSLAQRIVEQYHKENVVLSSHLVAFSAFTLLQSMNPDLDLYGLLRLPADDVLLPKTKLYACVDRIRLRLQEMEAAGQVKLSEQIHWPTEKLIKDGVKNLGIYHPIKPLRFVKSGDLRSDDFKVLYFYRNRLDHYGLDQVLSTSLQAENA